MQDIATYLNDNYSRFQTTKRSFTNDKNESIEFDQLQIVTGVGENERVYDIKLGRDAKILARADAERAAKSLGVQ